MAPTETCRQRIYSVNLNVLVYLDPDGLPPEDSDEFREIIAEHVTDFIAHNDESGPGMWEEIIDSVELIDEYDLITGRR